MVEVGAAVVVRAVANKAAAEADVAPGNNRAPEPGL